MLPANCNLWEDFGGAVRFVMISTTSLAAEVALISQTFFTALKAITFPLERFKIKMQNSNQYVTRGYLGYQELNYNYMMDYKKGGFSGLFQGLRAALDRQFFYALSRFYIYHYVKNCFRLNSDLQGHSEHWKKRKASLGANSAFDYSCCDSGRTSWPHQ